MFNPKYYTILGLFLLFSLGQANAGSLTISERVDPYVGYYSVINDGLADIKFFAVGHVNAAYADSHFPEGTFNARFKGQNYAKFIWDLGIPIEETGVHSSSFEFDDYFGVNDTVVNTFFDSEGSDFGIADGDNTTDLFSYTYFGPKPVLSSSLWLAVDVNDVVYTGMTTIVNVNAVPLPAAAVLLAPALLGFLGFRRKLQA